MKSNVNVDLGLRAALVLGLAVACSPAPVSGQDPFSSGDREFVDRVAAVVGDSVVTASQVTERMFQLGPDNIPTDSAAVEELRSQLLEALIN